MPIKLLLTYDIVPGQEQNYFEFVVREFVPGLQKLGMTPTEAWYTTYGDRPQFLTGAIADDLKSMKDALSSEAWDELEDGLLAFATNFSRRVVPNRSRFQM